MMSKRPQNIRSSPLRSHDLITDGTMPAGKSFSAFQKLCTLAPKR
jgi:hypothetical protein